MKMVDTMLLKSILFAILVSIANSEPPNECTTPLNHSDCGQPATMVYTNFSPMAICHPAIWRGCPTKNKFVNEYQCMEFCLLNKEVKTIRCDVPLNISRCSKQKKEVYTYSDNAKSCVKAFWYGCPSENKFNNMTSCMNGCHMAWVDTLAKMDISEVRETSKVLNNLINKMNQPRDLRMNNGKRTKVNDRSAKAYFLRKLQKVNRELEERSSHGYTNLMIMDDM